MMFHHLAGLRRVHFVGIGGVGMSGIAELLLDYDLEVSGSDLQLNPATERLADLGVDVSQGHHAQHLEGVDLVVVSSAVDAGNIEVREARERGITVVRRAEMLAEMMRLKYGIAVAGAHGKTTTTSLVGTVLTEGGLDPTVIVGGRLRLTGTGARRGASDFLVVEADEFDRSFLTLAPIIAIITNIDLEHLDTYSSLEDIQNAFVRFASRVPFFGQVIVCLDDPHVQEILPRLAERRLTTYGLSPQAELVATDLERMTNGCSFVVRHRTLGELGRVELPMPGEHNVLNALASVATAMALGIDFGKAAAALGEFGGVHRRFERLGLWRGAAVVDDYAHHPTEVLATLKAAREGLSGGELHAVFQPHLFSRTRDHAEEFGRSLLLADSATVVDIYPSREKPLPGVTAKLVVAAARASGHRRVRYCADWQDVGRLLADEVGAGDMVITLGAGNINRLAEQLAGADGADAGGLAG